VSGARVLLATAAVTLAFLLQVSVLSFFAWHGVVPDLVLLVVVAAGLARGPAFGMWVGFAAGLLLDVAPPADHAAGRWALAMLLAGFVAGRMSQQRPSPLTVCATVAGCSFAALSVYVLTGAALGESLGSPMTTVLLGVGVDLLLTPLVVPLTLTAFARLETARG
jgi:rod shape-determining protein MreD